jgi:hypothetical protein
VQRFLRVDHPPLWLKHLRVWIDVGISVHRPGGDPDLHPGLKIVSVNGSALRCLAGEKSWDPGGHAEGLVDAGAHVLASEEFRPANNVFDIGELRPDLLL